MSAMSLYAGRVLKSCWPLYDKMSVSSLTMRIHAEISFLVFMDSGVSARMDVQITLRSDSSQQDLAYTGVI